MLSENFLNGFVGFDLKTRFSCALMDETLLERILDLRVCLLKFKIYNNIIFRNKYNTVLRQRKLNVNMFNFQYTENKY